MKRSADRREKEGEQGKRAKGSGGGGEEKAAGTSGGRRLHSGRIYFTKVDELPECFNECAYSLSELLAECRPESSCHFNFMLDLDWLIEQYPSACRGCPLQVVVGERMGTAGEDIRARAEGRGWTQVSVAQARLPIPYGTHHTKLSLLESEHSIHVIVSTANLVPEDWGGKTQCFYYACGSFRGDEGRRERSPFAADLVSYLNKYRLAETAYWVDRLKAADFGGCADRLVYSVPGYHQGEGINMVGHLRLRDLLSRMGKKEEEEGKEAEREAGIGPSARPAPATALAAQAGASTATAAQPSRPLLVAQCSSIGSLGARPDAWLTSQFTRSMQGGQADGSARLVLIYPCVSDVRGSVEGWGAGYSLPYQTATEEKQQWLRGFMCKWRSEQRGRSRAMPHVKTYTCLDAGRPRWQLLTSANLSKAAWGEMQKNGAQMMCRSWELGVLIADPTRCELPYDYPIAKYGKEDSPWVVDGRYEDTDRFGKTWIASRR